MGNLVDEIGEDLPALKSRYARACEYRDPVDVLRVEEALARYCVALGIERKVVRIERGWSADDPRYGDWARAAGQVRREREGWAAWEARETRAARAAWEANAARESQEIRAAWEARVVWAGRGGRGAWETREVREARRQVMFGHLSFRICDSSLVSTYFLGATQLGIKVVRAWSEPVFEAFLAGAEGFLWCGKTLYWLARPKVSLDDAKRLHSDSGPAIESDLEDQYFWHGACVPRRAIMDPDTITAVQCDEESNAEIRRALIERMGPGKYLAESGARTVDVDGGLRGTGGAPRALIESRSGDRWLVGTDGSTERVYYMAVPRDARTCSEAHGMIAGFKEDNLISES